MQKTLLAGATLVLAAAAHAETSLSPLLITALREPVTADRTLTAVNVIDRDEIDDRQPRSVIDLLRTEPGLEVSRNGGRGQVKVDALKAHQLAHVPGTANPDLVTLLEEDRIMGYFGSGTLYADSMRQEPMI